MICPNCSYNNDKDARFCIECGYNLLMPNSSDIPNIKKKISKAKKKPEKWVIAIIILFVVLLNLFIIALALALTKPDLNIIRNLISFTIFDMLPGEEVALNDKAKNNIDDIKSLSQVNKKSIDEFIKKLDKNDIKKSIAYNIKKKKENFHHSKIFAPDKKKVEIKSELKWINSKYLGTVPVYFVLPPSYDEDKKKHYPSLILLGGASGAKQGHLFSAEYWVSRCYIKNSLQNLYNVSNKENTFKNGFFKEQKEYFTKLFENHKMLETIYICPHTQNGGIGSRYSKYIVEELIPYTEKNYRVINDRLFRAIDGACLGGAHSLYLGFSYPEIFASIGGLQADVLDFGNIIKKKIDENIEEIKRYQIRININTATYDVYKPYLIDFAEYLDKLNIKNTFNIYPGEHTYSFYRKQGGYDTLIFHNISFNENFDKMKE